MPSGLKGLDRLLSGFQPSNLIILAARPGMGKTSLALGIARHVGVEANLPVAVFSLEMSRHEVTQRLMCAEALVDSQSLRTRHDAAGGLGPPGRPRATACRGRRSTSTTRPAST